MRWRVISSIQERQPVPALPVGILQEKRSKQSNPRKHYRLFSAPTRAPSPASHNASQYLGKITTLWAAANRALRW